MGASVTNIQARAFDYTKKLSAVYYLGNKPNADSTIFVNSSPTNYVRSGSTGWANNFISRPVQIWQINSPQLILSNLNQSNGRFGCSISYTVSSAVPFEIQKSNDLLTWETLFDGVGDGMTKNYVSIPETNDKNFYRIMQE